MSLLIQIVYILFRIITLIILAQVVLSYFMSPYHPIREMLDRLVDPFLRPIRRIVPAVGGLDFSPLILLVVVQLLGQVLIYLLTGLF